MRWRADRYHADPSGSYIQFDAKAIGAGAEAAQAQLLEDYKKVRVQWMWCACAIWARRGL